MAQWSAKKEQVRKDEKAQQFRLRTQMILKPIIERRLGVLAILRANGWQVQCILGLPPNWKRSDVFPCDDDAALESVDFEVKPPVGASDYCLANPGKRFWQALRNWSGHNFIIIASGMAPSPLSEHQKDTFYWEGKGQKK